MLANKPNCWRTNHNAGKQNEMLTNKPKFWQTNQNSSRQTKFACQNSALRQNLDKNKILTNKSIHFIFKSSINIPPKKLSKKVPKNSKKNSKKIPEILKISKIRWWKNQWNDVNDNISNFVTSLPLNFDALF